MLSLGVNLKLTLASYLAIAAVIGVFTPSSLFASNEQGVWYDPSDFSTMFQDSTGVTPVTAVEQPVGLILDKSKGLVLGPNLTVLANAVESDTNATTGWTAVTTDVFESQSAVTNGSAFAFYVNSNTTAVASARIYRSVTETTVGKWYKLEFDIRHEGTGGAWGVYLGALNTSVTTLVTAVLVTDVTFTRKTYYFLASAGTAFLIAREINASNNGGVYIDNLTIKEVPGNHAFQATPASRPVLSARVNQLTKTEEFNDAAWTKVNTTIDANASAAPNGTTTADLVKPTTTGLDRYIRQLPTVANGATYESTTYAKASGIGFVYFADINNVFNNVWFDLTNGTTSTPSVGTASMTSVGNGWWRCVQTTTASSTAGAFFVALADTSGSRTSTSNGNNGVLLWGADLRVTNDGVGLPVYQRVNTSTDYDTTGFPLYLRFDGTDDSMATAAINFTATDKMSIFSGVRKNSDALAGMLLELSITIGSNDGSFYLEAPSSSAAADYQLASKGTVARTATTPATYGAPITNVLTGLNDISGDTITLRANGTQVAQDTGNQGTGNYGNYPLFIGRRNNVNQPFNGRIYSLIVRGAASTATEITNTETWVNGKTGAY